MKNLNNNLSDERIINFLRYLKNGGAELKEVFAVELVNDELDEGKTLEEIFKRNNEGLGYFINIENLSENEYKIKFRCIAGPTAGDGGEWYVKFDDQNNVVECTQESFIIS